MIIKGTSRAKPIELARHLLNAEQNERIQLLETRGTVAQDLRGALIEMDAYAAGTRCEKPLYHAAISPGLPHTLTPEQRAEAIEALEERLGLTGHARAVVMHDKHGRQHIHVVWSRIDIDHMRSVSDSHNYRKHEEVARELERRFGHERVQGAHHEREGVKRPDRTPSRAELRQEERTGIKGKDVKAEVSAAFRASDSAEAFKAALEEKGYQLARGDRRDFVIVDRAGGVHSLARRIDGMRAAELREFMGPLDRNSLPDLETARRIAVERTRQAEEWNEQRKDAKLEKDYGRGADYVSHTTAAQRDAKRRHKALNEDLPMTAKQRAHFERQLRATTRESERGRQRSEAGREVTATNLQRPAKATRREATPYDKIEMTDAQRARLDRLRHGNRQNSERARERGDDDPGGRGGAPGGGRTRGR